MALAVFVSGCATPKPSGIFNRETLYKVPPGGTWVGEVMYYTGGGTWKKTGALYLPPGTLIGAGE